MFSHFLKFLGRSLLYLCVSLRSANQRLQVNLVWLLGVRPFFASLRARSTEPLRAAKSPLKKAEERANAIILLVAAQNEQIVCRKPMQFFRAWACEQGGVKMEFPTERP